MRRLELVIGRERGALPAIAAVSLLPVLGSCGARSGLLGAEEARDGGHGGTPSGGSGGTPTGGGAGSFTGGTGGTGGGIILGGAGGLGGSGATGGVGGAGGGDPWCSPLHKYETYTVYVPPPGVPAEPGQICAVSADPVESNEAARITLTKYSPALELAQGFIALEPKLEGSVVGTPAVVVKSAGSTELMSMQVSGLTKVAGGYSFMANWPEPLSLKPYGWAGLTLLTELELDCGGSTRKVVSTTFIELCIGDTDLEWVSSGDQCTICDQIAEKAPSPILPDPVPDGLPLSRAFRLRIAELARAGNTLVLLAENDAGEHASYTWHPSSGMVEEIAPDVVLWTAEPGGESRTLQVAIECDDGAAVASYDWDDPP